MTTPTIADYLKYANLQMAAEAFLFNDDGTQKQNVKQALIDGNGHATYFTQTQAEAFVDPQTGWTVVDQLANSSTGFSGTLFRNNQTGELVLSFRSTEFIDDAIRDSAATNTLEVHDTGFAWGQISDMEDWYKSLKESGQIPAGSQLNVTGYSLGGHLATAFNLLHQNELNGGQVVTFNGAGVGQIKSGDTLQSALAYFNDLRQNPGHIKSALNFSLGGLADFYDTLQTNLVNHIWTAQDCLDRLADLRTTEFNDTQWPTFDAEAAPLKQALGDIVKLQDEAARIKPFVAGGTGPDANTSPKDVLATDILAETLDYRLAVNLAAQKSIGATILGDAFQIDQKKYGASLPGNQYDVVGIETTTPPWSAVSFSQLHYGTNVPLFIEDQPLVRGGFVPNLIEGLITSGSPQLLQDHYAENNFADTHSLTLIVDSLNVQNVLLNLLPESQRTDEATAAKLQEILLEASWRKAENGNGSQGKAEGDVLENVLDALIQTFTHSDPKLRDGKTKNNVDLNIGNTWADTTLRQNFYDQLDALQKSGAYKELSGKITLDRPNAGQLAAQVRTDFVSMVSLLTLSPFVLKAVAGNEAAVEIALGTAWAAEYADWQADQTLIPTQLAQGQGNYTETYLQDRIQMLGYLSKFNLTNGQRNIDPAIPTISRSYQDVDKDISLIVDRTSNTTPTNLLRPQIIFGTTDNDILWGGDEADHLFGGAGSDRLDGGKGDDYLEGNAGSDILTGGEGKDTLLGGTGSDILDGGKGNDRLDGGLGDDTYQFTSGDGWDWIEDKDGVGHIEYDGKVLSGGPAVGDSGQAWQEKIGDITFTYLLSDWTEDGEIFQRLSIQGPDGGMWVKRWVAGQLGITLPGASAPEELPSGSPEVFINTTSWYNQNHYVVDGRELGRVELSAVGNYGEVRGSGRLLGNDTVNRLISGDSDSDSDSELYGYGGNDTLHWGANNVLLDGGKDHLRSHAANEASFRGVA
jgi:hypothetical protein